MDSTESVSNDQARIWHQKDTVISLVKWTSDSVRQIKLELNSSRDMYLEAQSDAPVYLFYGKELISRSSEGFLSHSFKDLEAEAAFLNLSRDVQKLKFGVYSYEEKKDNATYTSLEKAKRESKWVSDNVLLILLIGVSLIMVIVKFNYDKRYSNILSFYKVFTTRLNEGDQSRVRIMDQDNLVFAGFYVFVMGGLIYFLSLGRNAAFLGIEASGVFEYLKMMIIVAAGLIAKVILIAIVSNLFGNKKIAAFYVKELLNINLFFVIILFFSSILIFLLKGGIPAFWLSTVMYLMFLFYIIRLILLYFKILKLSSFTNLYLFSYFCTTEIFPFLIGLKYFLR